MPLHVIGIAGFGLAALPFLPAGKGALILLAGGLSAVSVSLAWAILAPQRRLAPPGPSHFTARPGRASRPPALSPKSWIVVGERVDEPHMPWAQALAGKATLQEGRVRVVRATASSCVLLVEACRACAGTARRGPCESVRSALEAVARVHHPGTTVVQVARSSPHRAGCAFSVQRGG